MDKLTILVVDDDAVMLNACREIFADEKYRLEHIRDANTGLKILKKIQPDLVVIDLKLAGKNGIELVKEVKNKNPDCLPVIITDYDTIESAAEASRIGACDFLTKPFTIEQLRFIIRRGFDQRRFVLETESLKQEKGIMRSYFISMTTHTLRIHLTVIEQDLLLLIDKIAEEESHETRYLLESLYMRISILLSQFDEWLNRIHLESKENSSLEKPINNDVSIS
ncbi:response regulator [bacterium]